MPSDIALRAVKGEYNITSRVSEKYNCPAGKISLPLKAAISLDFRHMGALLRAKGLTNSHFYAILKKEKEIDKSVFV